MEDPTPKKISADDIEVIDKKGQVIHEGKNVDHSNDSPFDQVRLGGLRVIHSGPLALLAIPLLLPVLLIAMFILIIAALFMGTGVFRIFRTKS